jgi:predicted metal-dependent RNase
VDEVQEWRKKFDRLEGPDMIHFVAAHIVPEFNVIIIEMKQIHPVLISGVHMKECGSMPQVPRFFIGGQFVEFV